MTMDITPKSKIIPTGVILTDKQSDYLASNSHCSAPSGSEWFNKLPKQLPQRQDSLLDQLHDLQRVATRLGMYDAADYINSIQNSPHHASEP